MSAGLSYYDHMTLPVAWLLHSLEYSSLTVHKCNIQVAPGATHLQFLPRASLDSAAVQQSQIPPK